MCWRRRRRSTSRIQLRLAFGIQMAKSRRASLSIKWMWFCSTGYRRTSSIFWCFAWVRNDCKRDLKFRFNLLMISFDYSMIHVQNKISQGLEVLQFFTMRNWVFASHKFKDLNNYLSPHEYKMFFIDTEAVPDSFEDEFVKNCLLGGRQYVLKEPLSTIPRARIQMKV